MGESIVFIEAGQIQNGTDPTYGDPEWTTVYECGRCGALISYWRTDDHRSWHAMTEERIHA